MNRPPSFLDFASLASRGIFTPAPHIVLLAEYLEALRRREIRKLMIEWPPRHAKSTTVDELWLPYWLLENPNDRAVLASYEATFAATWGRKAREVVNDVGRSHYGYGVKSDSEAKNDWEIEGHRGGMFTTGIGGPITGRGFNIGVIDDPVKNEQEASSETIQQRNYDWYRSTFSTRKEPDAVEILIMTRWHEADLAGRLLDEEAHEWTVVSLPALAEDNDLMDRAIGEPLWPERYDAAALADIRYGKVDPETGQRHGGIGSYFWNALYQQRPASEEGSIFKRGWWNRYDELPSTPLSGYTIVDTAGYDDKTTGDYAAIATVVRVGKDLYWRDVQRGHWEFPELQQRALDARDEHGFPILIEETPWAKPLIQSLKLKVNGVVAFKIEGKSKLTRAQAASPFAEAGNFYLPRQGRWVNDFIEEHAAFPKGAHDDMVDTTSMAVLRLLLGIGAQNGDLNAGARRYEPTVRRGV